MRHVAIVLALLAATVAVIRAPAQAQEELPLAERRAVAAFQERRLPALVADIQRAAGMEVPIEVRWNEVALRGHADDYNNDDFFVAIYFRPLAKALAQVAGDQMGKDALKAKLKSITIRYDASTAPASAYENGLTFQGGVLTVNFAPYSNVADVDDRAAAIRKILESKL